MDANREHRRAATASEAEWDRTADPEAGDTAPIVVVDVQPDGALDLFDIEPDGFADPSNGLDPLAQFAHESGAIEPTEAPVALEPAFDLAFEPPFEPPFEPAFDTAADAVAARLAATAPAQPSSWPARRSDPADRKFSEHPNSIPPIPARPSIPSPVVKPVPRFASRQFWVGVTVVGLLAAAAVPGMAILGRSSASAPVQRVSTAPALAAPPASTVNAGSPAPASALPPAPIPPRAVTSPAQRPDVRPPPASQPVAAPAGAAITRNTPPPPAPERNLPPAAAPERSAAATSPSDRSVSAPPPVRTAATTTTGLAAPAVAQPQAPPAAQPIAPREVSPPAAPPAATLPVPSGSSSSPARLETRAAAPPVNLPPVSLEPATTLPPPAPPPAVPAAVSAAAPAALPPRAASVIPVARPSDNDAIQTTLGRYRAAFSGLDASAAGAVWPSVDQKALERAFARLEHQLLTFTTCAIDVRGVRAVATCLGTADYIPKVGSKSYRSDPRQWVFNLRKVDEQWLIDTVNSR